MPAVFRRSRNFLERTAIRITAALDHAGHTGETSHKRGILQQIDPRVKVFGFLLLIVIAACARNLSATITLFGFALIFAALSQISFRTLALSLWSGVLFLSLMLALPAVFLTPGNAVARLPLLGWPLTSQGLLSAARLVARGEVVIVDERLGVTMTEIIKDGDSAA